MKPSDAFIGVIDFFSTLIPGSIATYLFIMTSLFDLDTWLTPGFEITEKWVVFLVLAYLLGHIIAAVGSLFLDPFYDRVYVRWKRAGPGYIDGLLKVAQHVKAQQLIEISKTTQVPPGKISNTYWWAGSVIRLKAPAGSVEVDALSAQSKLFRSITLILPFAAFGISNINLFTLLGWITFFTWLLAFFLCLWRFMDLRWKATERTYEYFILTSLSNYDTKGKSDLYDDD